LAAGVIHVALPAETVTRMLGRRGAGAVFKACLLGIPLPLCSCSVIPVASAIRKQGAGRGAFVSFLISTPETGVDSIAISYALLGPLMAVIRPVAAFVTAILAGLLIDRTEAPETDAANPAHDVSAACGCGDKCATNIAATKRNKLTTALRYGLIELFVDLSPYLIGGFVLAGLIAALVPPDWLTNHIGTGLPAMLLMLVVGLPLYICATSSTPLAAALIAGGLSPGAALVFLLVGPATNIATMLIVVRETSKSGLAIYLATIGGCAVAFGLAVDWLVTLVPPALNPESCCGDAVNSVLARICAVSVSLLLVNGLRIRLAQRMESAKEKR